MSSSKKPEDIQLEINTIDEYEFEISMIKEFELNIETKL